MNKKVVAWTIGSALFAGIAGFWAYNLPATLKHSAAGRVDKDLEGIVSSFNGSDDSLSADLKRLENDFDKGLVNIKNAVQTEDAKAEAIVDLKEKIMDKNINADLNANTNANLPVAGQELNANIPNVR